MLLFDLGRPEDFIRVFGTVVTAQAQSIAGHAVQVFDSQHAVVLDRVDFPVDDLGKAMTTLHSQSLILPQSNPKVEYDNQ